MQRAAGPVVEGGHPSLPRAGTAVVTGATGGLGSAFAHARASQGYDLFLTDRDAIELDKLAGIRWHGRAISVATEAADFTRVGDLRQIEGKLAAVEDLRYWSTMRALAPTRCFTKPN